MVGWDFSSHSRHVLKKCHLARCRVKKTAEPSAAEDSPEQSEEKSRSMILLAAVRNKQYTSLNGLHSESIIGTLGPHHRKWQCTCADFQGRKHPGQQTCVPTLGRTHASCDVAEELVSHCQRSIGLAVHEHANRALLGAHALWLHAGVRALVGHGYVAFCVHAPCMIRRGGLCDCPRQRQW